MIPNHAGFVQAIHDRKKVCVRFYSKADNGVLDRVCAPMDYGLGDGINDGLGRYRLWDFSSTTGSHTLNLLDVQIQDLQVLGEVFDPASLVLRPLHWSIPRNWGGMPMPLDEQTGAASLGN
jgi:hypothetical protein